MLPHSNCGQSWNYWDRRAMAGWLQPTTVYKEGNELSPESLSFLLPRLTISVQQCTVTAANLSPAHILLPSIFTTIPAQPAGVSMISLQCDKSAHISNVIHIKQQQSSFLARIVIIRKMYKRLCLFVLCCNGRGA